MKTEKKKKKYDLNTEITEKGFEISCLSTENKNLISQLKDIKSTMDDKIKIGKIFLEKKQKYNMSKAIIKAISDDPMKNEKNALLALQAIEDVNSRVYPTPTEKVHETISEMDAYYIPEDLN